MNTILKVMGGALSLLLALILIVVDFAIGPALRWSGIYGLGVAVTPDLGHGAVITFSSSFLAKVLTLELSGIKREPVETTTLETSGGKTFMPADNYDPGELKGTMQFDTDASPPIGGAAEAVTVTWPDAETWAGNGFLTEFNVTGIENEKVMEGEFTLKMSGSWTF